MSKANPTGESSAHTPPPPPRPKLYQHPIAYLKLLLIIASTFIHAGLIALLFGRLQGLKDALLKSWGRTLSWVLGVKVTHEGVKSRAREGAIVIANHTSYADIPVLMAHMPSVFLAKAEVSKWPVIGWAGRVVGTVFVDRSSPESREASRELLKRRVAEGARVLVFAEGTTTPRGEVHPLKPGMFHEAASAGLPIQLVSLEFAEDSDAWVGDDPLWPHFVRTFGRLRTRAHLHVHAEVLRGEDGHQLREEAERWLKEQATHAAARHVKRA